ncbi:MAG: YhbY family RNA-binding protein [Eubacteriales bacterium]|nr:YhbY family RNA-binding protein [Eubacteriales bacterium]
MLTSKERAALRARAVSEPDRMQIGKNELTEAAVLEMNHLLEDWELVKVRVLETSGKAPGEVCDELAERCHAEPVQVIGRKFVLYRKSRKLEEKRRKRAEAEKRLAKNQKQGRSSGKKPLKSGPRRASRSGKSGKR